MKIFFNYIILFGLFFCLILAIGQVVVKKKKVNNYSLFVLLLCVAITMGKSIFKQFLNVNDYQQIYSFVLIFDIASLTAIGPLLYLYIQTLINENYKYSRRQLISFFFSFAMFFFMSTLYLKNDFILSNKQVSFYIKLGAFHLFLYEIYTFYKIIKKTISQKDKIDEQTIVSTIILVGAISQNILWFLRFWRLSFVIVVVIMIIIYIISHRNSLFLQISATSKLNNHYVKSQIKFIDIEQTIAALLNKMRNEKIYQDEGLNLAKTAQMLSVTTHQLSEILNKHLKKSFINFVNEFRVKEAQKLLIDEPDSSILSICFQVGFNSNSAFYTAFKKISKLNPNQYRKKFLG